MTFERVPGTYSSHRLWGYPDGPIDRMLFSRSVREPVTDPAQVAERPIHPCPYRQAGCHRARNPHTHGRRVVRGETEYRLWGHPDSPIDRMLIERETEPDGRDMLFSTEVTAPVATPIYVVERCERAAHPADRHHHTRPPGTDEWRFWRAEGGQGVPGFEHYEVNRHPDGTRRVFGKGAVVYQRITEEVEVYE